MSEEEPIAVEYKRWRHKKRGYEVTVTSVQHFQTVDGWFALIRVREKSATREKSWTSKVFFDTFEPLGRKLRIRTRWERIRRG